MEYQIFSPTDVLTDQLNMKDKEDDKAEDLLKIKSNYTYYIQTKPIKPPNKV